MTNVLLIDDDIELTNLLGEYLTEEGFVVETTADGRIGVAEAMSPSTDIVVLDIMMPRMSGIEVLRKIRQVSDVPVLMLTARGDDVDRISGLNLGADDYVLVHRASLRHGSVRSALAWRSHVGRQNGTVVRQPRKTRRLGV
ncbi:hypothetical protein ACQY74_000583 (plasmid) [Rhizobium leguminosarum bv. trifolii]